MQSGARNQRQFALRMAALRSARVHPVGAPAPSAGDPAEGSGVSKAAAAVGFRRPAGPAVGAGGRGRRRPKGGFDLSPAPARAKASKDRVWNCKLRK
jgi:hypothetical protein